MAERRHGPFEMAVMSSVLSVNYSFTQQCIAIGRFCLVLGYENFRHEYRILSIFEPARQAIGMLEGKHQSSMGELWSRSFRGPLPAP